jgi:hypothetical protein
MENSNIRWRLGKQIKFKDSVCYKKDFNSNKVALRGYLLDGAYGSSNIICNLPVGYRPYRTHEMSVASGSTSGTCKLVVTNTGDVYAIGGANEVVLDGVEFYLD